MNEVLIVMPMYGFHEMTREALDYAILNAGMECDILVVDDGSQEPFRDERVEVLRLEKNSGFTNAVNQGILWAGDRYKYIHLLNNDTRGEPDFVKNLYDVIERDEKIALTGSVRIKTHEGGSIEYENYGSDLIRGFQLFSYEELPMEEIETVWIPFCSVMISMKALRYLGLPDPSMRNHCSDNDFCVRARVKGWKVVLVTSSKVHHIHQVTILSNGINSKDDQLRFLEIISGLKYAEIMTEIPVDYEAGTWGRVMFDLVKKGPK